jgi:protoheme IX farnesyltransferase
VRSRIGAYVALTTPRILELLLVTTVPTMVLAQGGLPGVWLIVATLIGGTLAAGSANAFNCVYDRDIDAVMSRTKHRPLVTGEVSVRGALVLATVLGVISVAWFAVVVNVFSALLALAAILLYVVFYTIILKRRTSQNIVWGGVAGCMPIFIGWAAVTGSLDWAPVALFGVVFFWTPPHYWPLAVKFKADYQKAHVPMLPAVASDRRVAAEMIGHTLAMLACSFALIPLARMTWVYAVVAGLLALWFGRLVVRMLIAAQRGTAHVGKLSMSVFHGSIVYLTILFVAVAIDVFLPL